MTRTLSSNKKGAMRILETVIAATIILLVFTAATFLVQSSNVNTTAQTKDLDNLGYNVLTQSLNAGLIEKTVETNTVVQSAQIRTYIQNALPLGVYFNITVTKYQANTVTNWVNDDIAIVSVDNVDNDRTIFEQSQVSSTPTIYSSKNGGTYLVTLVLAEAGGK